MNSLQVKDQIMKQMFNSGFIQNTTGSDITTDVVDESGNKIGTTTTKTGDYNALPTQSSVKVNSNGSFSSVSLDQQRKTSITYDSKNNKITIHAPQAVLDSDTIKNLFTNSDSNSTFTTLAKAYMADPDADTTVTRTNSDGEEEEVKISDWIKEYEDELQNYTYEYYDVILPNRTRMANFIKGGNADDISDTAVEILSGALNKANDSNSDSKVFYIPDAWKNLYDWSSLKSYDKDSNTISAADFFRAYDLEGDGGTYDDGTKIKGFQKETIDKMRDTATDILAYYAKNEDATKEGSSAYEEFAKVYAAYSTIKNNDPDASVGTNVWMFTRSAAVGFYDNILNIGSDKSVVGWLTTNIGKGVYNTIEFTHNTISDITESALGINNDPQRKSLFALISALGEIDLDYGISKGELARFRDKLDTINSDGQSAFVSLYGVDLAEEWGEAAEDFNDYVDSIDDELDSLTATGNAARVGSFFGQMAAEMIKQKMFTDVAGAGASSFTENLIESFTNGSFAQGLARLASLGEAGTKISGLVLSKITSAASFASNIAMQGVVDTALNNFDLVSSLWNGGEYSINDFSNKEIADSIINNTSLSKQSLLDAYKTNTAVNALGEMIGGIVSSSTAKKAVKWSADKVGNTFLGRFAARGVSAVKGKVAKTGLSLLDKLAPVEKALVDNAEAVGGSANAASYARAAKSVDIGGEEAIAQSTTKAEFETAQSTLVKFRAMYQDVISGIRSSLVRLDSDAAVKAARASTDAAWTDLVTTAGKRGVKDIAGEAGSEELNKYLSAKYLSQTYLPGKETAGFALSKYEKTVKATGDEIIKAFEGEHGKEVQKAAEKYLKELKKQYATLADFEVKNGIRSAQWVEDLKKNKIWGENGDQYIGLKSLGKDASGDAKAVSDYVDEMATWATEGGKPRMAKAFADDYSLTLDAGFNYMSPQMAVYARRVADARIIQAKGWGEAIKAIDSTARELESNGVIRYADKSGLNAAKNAMHNALSEMRVLGATTASGKKGMSNLIDEANLFDEFFKMKEAPEAFKAYDETIGKWAGVDFAGFDRSAVEKFTTTEVKDSLRSAGFEIPEYGSFNTAKEFHDWYDQLDGLQQMTVRRATGTPSGNSSVNFYSFNKAIKSADSTLASDLQTDYLMVNIGRLQKDQYKNIYRNAALAKMEVENNTLFKAINDDVQTLISRTGIEGSKVGEVINSFNNSVDGVKDTLIRKVCQQASLNPATVAYAKKFAEETGMSEELMIRYLALNTMAGETTGAATKYQKEFFGKINDGLEEAIAKWNKNVDPNMLRAPSGKSLEEILESGDLDSLTATLKGEDKAEFKKLVKDRLYSSIDSDFNKTVRQIMDGGGTEWVDTDAVYKKIDKLMKEVNADYQAVKSNGRMIEMLDAEGKFRFYEVSPQASFLYNYRINLATLYGKQTGAGAGVSRGIKKINSLFRDSTTGFMNMASTIRQYTRDPFNAVIMGGMRDTIKNNQKAIADTFGDDVLATLKEELSDKSYKQFLKNAQESGISAKEAAVNWYTTDAASAVYQDSSLKEFYRDTARKYQGVIEQDVAKMRGDTSAMDKAKKVWESVKDAATKPDDIRETYLRKNVWTQNFYDALQAGKGVREASAWASNAARNATTNFQMPLLIGNTFFAHVPYFTAAINGSKSMWSLFELDPVGTMQRMVGCVIVPYMQSVAYIASDPTLKEQYKQLNEYEKDGYLIIAPYGHLMKIALPQELSAFINPFRHAVELGSGMSSGDAGELFFNDVLSISPVDLSGLSTVDDNKALASSDFWGNISDKASDEFRTLISQIAPPVLKSIYIAQTGIDPYSGNVVNAENWYEDEEGNIVYMTNSDSSFAQWLSDTAKKCGITWTPTQAEYILKNLLGQGAYDITSDIMDVFSDDPADYLSNINDRLNDQLVSPVTVTANSQQQQAWSQAQKYLQNMKNDLTRADGKLQEISDKIQALDATSADYKTKKAELQAQFDEETYEYDQKVLSVVKQLNEEYGYYTSSQFYSTIELLSFNNVISRETTNEEMYDNDSTYWELRDDALATMEKFGFIEPTDGSMLGYHKTSASGEYQSATQKSIGLMRSSNAAYQSDAFQADMKQILEASDISTSDMWEGYYAAKAKGSSALKQYKSAWNTKVASLLYNYVRKHGVDTVINDSNTRDFLTGYMFVSEYQAKKYLKEVFGDD